jgi:hypothetical protein
VGDGPDRHEIEEQLGEPRFGLVRKPAGSAQLGAQGEEQIKLIASKLGSW